MWQCRCDCGKELAVRVGQLHNKSPRSCGCVHGVKLSTPIQHDELLKLVVYNPASGQFTAKVEWRSCAAGSIIGCVDVGSKYYRVVLGRKYYYGHTLAWFYVTGEWPPSGSYVDHKNTNRADNRWDNLRIATPSQNNGNLPLRSDNSTGYKGVYFYGDRPKPWNARVKNKCIGYFATAAEAAEAYDRVASKVFGEFARGNF